MRLRHLVPSLAACIAPLWAAESATAPQRRDAIVEAGGRIVVSGDRDAGTPGDTRVWSSSVATKTDTPLLDIPQAVTVQDQRFLQDISANSIMQAYDYAVGISPQGTTNAGPGYARGFNISWYDIRRDGLRTYAWSIREPFVAERIAYLRGPSSVLYGDGSPGALINIVLKKPQYEARNEVAVAVGTNDSYRMEADSTGALLGSETVAYRAIAVYEATDQRYDNDERRMLFLPTVAWTPRVGTTITADMEVYYEQQKAFAGTLLPYDSPNTRLTNLDFNPSESGDRWWNANISPGLRLDQSLAQDWDLHVAGRATKIPARYLTHGGVGLQADERIVDRVTYNGKYVWWEYQSDTFVTGKIHTGPILHELVTGVEAGVSTTEGYFQQQEAFDLDLHQPQYGFKAPYPPSPSMDDQANRTDRGGVYVQDQAHLTQWLILVGSLRWSWIRANDLSGDTDVTQIDSDWSSRLGVVIKPTDALSFYVSAADSFEPAYPGSYDQFGNPIDPILTRSIEGGGKTDLLEDRLSASISVYRMLRENVAQWQGGYYVQTGEVSSTGLEVELKGTLRDGWTLETGYAYNKTKIRVSETNPEEVGNELDNTPNHQGSLWTKYSVQENDVGGDWKELAGWGLGSGLVYEGSKWAETANNIRLHDWLRWDAGIYYEDPRGSGWSGNLFVNNVLDAGYIVSSFGDSYAAPGEERTITLNVSKVW
jgi:iron complex outermembrane receptor protein